MKTKARCKEKAFVAFFPLYHINRLLTPTKSKKKPGYSFYLFGKLVLIY